MTIPYPYLLSKSKLSLPDIINLSQPLVFSTLVLSEACLILLFFLLSIGKLKRNTSKQQTERSLQQIVTKHPIGIHLFPNCVVWIKLIGSSLPNKYLLLGFDILHQVKNVKITSSGLCYKSMIKPFTSTLKIYSLANSPPSYQAITDQILKFCPENHSLFTHPNRLWKNPKFFISLPFKLNEDSNPTKATHTGMTPQDLILA